MAVISFCIRSAIPGYMVEPPERTVLAYRSLRISMSHFMMELKQPSWMPTTSMPKKEGRNMDSGQRKRSLPTVKLGERRATTPELDLGMACEDCKPCCDERIICDTALIVLICLFLVSRKSSRTYFLYT